MKDVLLPVGTIVIPDIRSQENSTHMIIGKRCINPDSMKSWDYVGIPYPEGLKFNFPRSGHDVSSKEYNYVYFNHTDIERLSDGKVNDNGEE